MLTANIYQAKAKLSELINKSLKGDEVIITKAGEPVVQLVPITNILKMRKPGFWKGKVKIHKGFDTLPKNLLQAFASK